MIRIGLLGGSFNPAHRGHRRLSLHAMRVLALDELWWLVSPGNPLKEQADDMAPLQARIQSAREAARGLPIRVTAIERELGTRYTIDALRALKRRYPVPRFVWLMGTDNLAQFHRWRDWRRIAATVPIAVVPRPGYDGPCRRAPAMAWLRRFVRPAARASEWTMWRPPALVLLSLPPDPISATGLRAADPDWHRRVILASSAAPRDAVTRRPID